MTKTRVVQPSVAKRIAFATWARKNGIRRHSSATYYVPVDVEVPANLMIGAQVDGAPVKAPEPKKPTTRRRKTTDRGTVAEPAPPLAETHEPEFPTPEPQAEDVTTEVERGVPRHFFGRSEEE
jgi:hypothetical protein